jgi:hypothetical protein
VHVTVSASDSARGFSVAATNCVLDPASPPTAFLAIPAGCAYTGSGAGADVTSNGQHTAYAAGEDNVRTMGTPVSASFKIDQTPPSITFAGNVGSYGVPDTVAITCTAADAVSGIASSTCASASGPAWTSGAGSHTLNANATDNGENTSSPTSTFTVVIGTGPLCQLVTQFVVGSAKYKALTQSSRPSSTPSRPRSVTVGLRSRRSRRRLKPWR